MSEKSYGVDIALEYNDYWADLKGNSADIQLVKGANNLSQSIRNRIMTSFGDNPRHPTYGSRLHSLIGKGNNTILETIIRMMVMEALQEEGRIQLVSDIDVKFVSDMIHIQLHIIGIYSTKLAVQVNIGGIS